MKTAIVTGATSMLGIATIKHLIENEIRVIAISRANSRRLKDLPESNLITFVGCELEKLSGLDLGDTKADVFFHFAWGFTNHSSKEKYDLDIQNKNVEYTLAAINLAKRMRCSRFLGAGSQAEYGYKEYVIDEDTECTPNMAYGQAKLNAYKLGRELCKEYGLDYIWTRTFSVYGVNDGNTMVTYALECFQNNKIAQFSAGVQSWNYLFEDDAGEYFYRLGFYDESKFPDSLKQNGRLNCIVNVGNIESKQLKLYFEEMKNAFGEDFKYELASLKEGETINGIHPDVSRLIEITGYYPKYSFEDGMRIMKDKALSLK